MNKFITLESLEALEDESVVHEFIKELRTIGKEHYDDLERKRKEACIKDVTSDTRHIYTAQKEWVKKFFNI